MYKIPTFNLQQAYRFLLEALLEFVDGLLALRRELIVDLGNRRAEVVDKLALHGQAHVIGVLGEVSCACAADAERARGVNIEALML